MCTSAETALVSITQAMELVESKVSQGRMSVCRYVSDTSSLGHSIEAYSSDCTIKSCLHTQRGSKRVCLSVQGEHAEWKGLTAEDTAPKPTVSKVKEWH